MTKKIKDLAVKVGTYVSDGKDKNKYLNVGVVLETDDGGKFILLDRCFNPAGVPNPDGKSTVLISMFDVKDAPKEAKEARQAKSADVGAIVDDEVPF